MDSLHISPSNQDSRRQRSRTDKKTSHTSTELLGLNIIHAPKPSNSHLQYQSCLETAPSPTVEGELLQPAPLSTFSLLQLSAPPQQSSQVEFDWTFGQIKDSENSTSILRHSASRSSPELQPPQSPSTSTSTDMSTMGIQQYDPHFDAGLASSRHSYAWSNFDLNMNPEFFSPMSSPALGNSIAQFDEPRILPVYARSNSSSPRGSLTPEQRELKKQRDFVRKHSKARYRRESSTSSHYVLSQHPSPAVMSSHLSGYTSSLSPSPLLSTITPAIPGSDFITSFASNPAENIASELYAPAYTVGSNDFSTPAYNVPFTDSLQASLQSQALFQQNQSLLSMANQNYNSHQQFPNITRHDSSEQIRVVQSRPKPQCWDHGCNGRQFSTFSNLLRHQREKSGVASKSSCPNCGAEFTRTTARNGHMAHEKCKQRRNS